ncbi:unnamed protein product, partial [Adineta steineri]
MYAPESKSWQWTSLSEYITEDCCLLGDFNIDLEDKADEVVANDLLNWTESVRLVPVTPNAPTSRRSNRTIDYAFTKERSLSLQVCSDNTTSDHWPVL